MYTKHFGLREEPFNVTPDPKFLFPSVQHQKALASISHGVSMRKGMIALIGYAGTGKTTLIRTLLKGLNGDTVTSWVFNTALQTEDLVRYICRDFGLEVVSNDLSEIMMELYRLLISNYEEGKNTILIVDEAQNLNPRVLEQIRQLTNIETSTNKLLQVILSGQPKLEAYLDEPGLQQLNQRVSVRARLSALSHEETVEYIKHRLRVAGAGKRAIFQDEALDVIYRVSKGIPRVINIVCDNAMINAYQMDAKTIEANIIHSMCRRGEVTIEKSVKWSDKERSASTFVKEHMRRYRATRLLPPPASDTKKKSNFINVFDIPKQFGDVDLSALALA